MLENAVREDLELGTRLGILACAGQGPKGFGVEAEAGERGASNMQRTGTGAGTHSERHRRAIPLRLLPLVGMAAAIFFAFASQAVALAPLATEPKTSRVHATTAFLEGLVNPQGKETTYQFEYLTQSQWEQEGKSFAAAAKAPPSPAGIGAGTKDTPVAEKVSGLQPATAYRFRLLAESADGTNEAAGAFATYALPSVFGSCPNESFRYGVGANLPDCRAYEQASPVDKNGGNVGGSVELIKASLGGDGVTFESQAGIPGGDGSQTFPIYMASREGGGWVTRGMLPPGTENESGNILGWTPDFAWVFDAASRKLGGGQALIARPRQSNPLSTLIPYTTPVPDYGIAGASADDSTVLFAATGALPVKAGDPPPAAGKRNVYAWERGSEELSLAGVLPNGTVPAQGTSNITGYAQEMRAVAEDGSVFFTDEGTGQLYLRLHPTEAETAAKDGKGNCIPDPVLACTLAVSASQRSTPDPEPFQPTFRSASADGSAAYFTSKQELTDDANTKATPNVLGRADISGTEATDVEGDLASGPDISALAADGSHLYWVNTAANTIGRSNLQGGEEEPSCVALPQIEVEAGVFAPAGPRGIAVGAAADEGHLYWTNAADEVAGHGTIGRADIHANCAEIQASVDQEFVTGATDPRGIDSDGTYLYWCNGGAQATRAIGRATIGGGGADQKFADEGDIFKPQDVAVDPAHNHLYIARGKGGAIVRTKLDDGAENVGLSEGAGSAQQITTDGNHLYWVVAVTEAGKTENIDRSDLDGNNRETDFIAAQGATGIALGRGADSNHLYWGAHPSGRGEGLYRFDADTGDLTDVALPEHSTHGADVQGVLGTSGDGTSVYFAANGSFDGASEGGCNGTSGVCNLYLWHEEDPETHAGSVTFVSRLSGTDAEDWATRPPATQKTARVSADGSAVLFSSVRRTGGYDNVGPCGGLGGLGGGSAPCAELYRWQVGDQAPTCISCDPSGAPPAGPATLGTLKAGFLGAFIQTSLLSRNVSADGNRVFFETRDPLVAADTNGDEGCPGWGSGSQALTIKSCQDVYEWEASGTGSCSSDAQNGGCLYLLSNGTSDQASFFADADPSGNNAFILTASQLAGQDEDHLMDAYDVRVGGGLASQVKAEEVGCEGNVACRGSLPPPPSTQAPGSAGFVGEGNQIPKRPHKKKHKKKHHKHAKKQHQKAGKGKGAGR